MKTLFIAQLRTSKQIRQFRQDSRHDIPGQRLVSGQQLPSGIGALDPSGHLLVLHLSTSHPIRFSLASSHLETLGSHGRKLIAEPLILPCTTKAVDKLLPRRVIITIPNIFPLFVLCFVLCLISLPLSHIDSAHHHCPLPEVTGCQASRPLAHPACQPTGILISNSEGR